MLRNSEDSWGSVAKAFHWLIAALIFAQFPLGWVAVNLRLSPAKFYLFTWHKSIGLTILLLVVLRLLWRWANPVPRLPAGMRPWERAGARVDHLALYLLMFAAPLTGWVVDSASNIPFKMFWLFRPPRIVSPSKVLEEAFKGIHDNLSIAFAILLAVHIGAALWHHFFRHDAVLLRMMPGTGSGR
jgi:cytochrome b561